MPNPVLPIRRDRRSPQSFLGPLHLIALALLAGCSSSAGEDPLAQSGDGTKTGPALDAGFPEALGLDLSPVSADRIRLSWRTDVPATSWVEVGLTADYGVHVEALRELGLEHEVEVDGLSADAEYHFRVACADANGNVTLGDDQTFMLPDVSGPRLFDVEIRQESATALKVSWSTDEPATTDIVYGTTPDLTQGVSLQSSSEADSDVSLVTEHEQILEGLAPGTWFLRVAGRDDDGNVSRSQIKVGKLSDWVAPQLHGLVAEAVFPTSARVSLTTDEPASVRLDYGPSASFGYSIYGAVPGVVHSLEVSDLDPGAEMHYRVAANDASGNVRTSETLLFSLADKVGPDVSDFEVTHVGGQLKFTWATDEPALSRIDWGTTESYGNVAESATGYSLSHSLEFDALGFGTYFYRAVSSDSGGNATIQPGSFSHFDDKPPVITNVSAQTLWPGIALVTWDTDEPSDSIVQFGTSPDNLIGWATGLPALVEDHGAFLLGLIVGADYHYKVLSTDANGNTGSSGGHQFVSVDLAPPVISGLSLSQTSQETATVQWLTDEPAVYLVQYGKTTAFGQLSYDIATYTKNHTAHLTGLDTGTWYVQVLCADAIGNLSEAPVTTLEVSDVTPPEIGSVAAAPESDSVVITWQTDELANGRVEYGASPGYGQSVFESGPPTTDHRVEIANLAPETQYFFKVLSADAVGNQAVSGNMQFETEPAPSDVELKGEMTAWFPLELSVSGPIAHESDSNPNPFLDYRFMVRFTSPTGVTYMVPGFFAGDGSGGDSGDVWRARFAPSEAGEWSYDLRFHEGTEVAISTNFSSGATLAPHGTSGEFDIAPLDPNADGFYKWGLLEYVGEHYLKFRDGPWFLKGGTNSPENLLGYRGFDNTNDQPGGLNTGLPDGVHRYDTHRDDYESGDPWFSSEDTNYNSKGIIGALNYLESAHVNSAYFLPMNLGGDGREVYPFVGPSNNTFDKTHYDISKLAQWEEVLQHATARGIMLTFVLNETESQNENWLDQGKLGKERKLFYREMVARFAHHLALKWTLSEENDFSMAKLEEFSEYIDALDVYDHPTAFHTHMLPPSGNYSDYDAAVGDPYYEMTSIQCKPDDAGHVTERWLEDSAASGRKWVIDVDEIGPAAVGLTESNADEMRRTCLWDVYFSGGNVEWYFGYSALGGDLNVEDFRSREEMWDYMWYARDFIQDLPFHEMEPRDELVKGDGSVLGGAEVFAKRKWVYAVYFPDSTSTGTIDLTETPTVTFEKRWYNPRTGNFAGGISQVEGGEVLTNGNPPSVGPEKDWVLLYKRL